MRYYFAYFLLAFLWVGVAFGQRYHVTHYQRSDGLPANLTKTIAQDGNGFIWIGTDLGLVRFNGHHFQQTSGKLPSPYIKSFFRRKDGRLLAVTDKGIATLSVQPDSLYVTPFRELDSSGIQLNYPKEIVESCDGGLWISEDGTLVRFLKGSSRRYTFRTGAVNFLRSILMWEESCGEMAIGLPSGSFMFYDKNKEDFIPIQTSLERYKGVPMSASDKAQLMGQSAEQTLGFNAAVKSNTGQILVASTMGVLTYQIDFNAKVAYLIDRALPDVGFTHITEDPAGQLYLSTFTNGVYWANSQNDLHKAFPIEGLPFKVANFCFVDKDQNVWVSGDGGVALLRHQYFASLPWNNKQILPMRHFIGEDGGFYVIGNNQTLYHLTGLFYEWEWKPIATGVAYPESGIVISTSLRTSIRNGVYHYITGTPPVLWKHSYQGKTAVEIASLQGQSLLAEDAFGNLWGSQRDAIWLKKPQTELKRFIFKGAPLVLSSENGQQIYVSIYAEAEHYLFKFNFRTEQFEEIGVPIPASMLNEEERKLLAIVAVTQDGDGGFWLATSLGLWHIQNGKISHINLGNEYSKQHINAVLPDKQGGIWVGLNVALLYYKDGDVHEFTESDGLPTSHINQEGLKLDDFGRLWVATPAGIGYSQHSALNISKTASPILTEIKANGKYISTQRNNMTTRYHSYLEVSFVAPTYPSEKVQYRYRLNQGEDVLWSEPFIGTRILLPELEDGTYQLEIQAKQQGNYEWSQSTQMVFTVNPVWYLTWWGLPSTILGISLVVGGIVLLNAKRLRKQKRYLEHLVKVRTEEIHLQKEEISQQRDNFQELNETLNVAIGLVNKHKEEIELKNLNITDSIHYASRIQLAMLPVAAHIETMLPEHFILYRPRDIVSGDFYWCNQLEDGRVMLAVVDCTGHGVPGAFMSMIGNVLLNQLVFIRNITNPAQVLREMNRSVQSSLHQQDSFLQDGMDMAVCLIDKDHRRMQFAGAKNPLVYVQNGELHRIKGNSFPVGGEQAKHDPEYTLHEIDVTAPTSIYIFSDGYQDQFGGPHGKKFMTTRFRDLLFQIHTLPMKEQERRLKESLLEWMIASGEAYTQVDDILVLGMRICGSERPDCELCD